MINTHELELPLSRAIFIVPKVFEPLKFYCRYIFEKKGLSWTKQHRTDICFEKKHYRAVRSIKEQVYAVKRSLGLAKHIRTYFCFKKKELRTERSATEQIYAFRRIS